MVSAFAELCEERGVEPDEWRQSLASPLMPCKALIDMNEDELEEHYNVVEERAENTREDRALAILEATQEGMLERQARKVFSQNQSGGELHADQIPEMLERLRYEVTNTEVHFLLRKFDATEDFDMIPDKGFQLKQWLWLVGECQMLKNFYRIINPEAFEVCYETMIQNLKMQRDAGLEGTEEWPHIKPTGPGWFMTGGIKPGYSGPLKPYVWGLQPEVEEEMMRQMAAYRAERRPSVDSRGSSMADRRGSIADRRASMAERRGSMGDRRGSMADRRGSHVHHDHHHQHRTRRQSEFY